MLEIIALDQGTSYDVVHQRSTYLDKLILKSEQQGQQQFI
jgi:hypothetical protein